MGKVCQNILKDKSLVMDEATCIQKITTYDEAHPNNACSKKKTPNGKADCYKEIIKSTADSISTSPMFAWSVRPYAVWNWQSIGSSGGNVFGLRGAIGSTLGDLTILWGAGIGAEHGTSLPHLKELHDLKDERTGGSLYVESIVRSPLSNGSSWSKIDRDSRGMGLSSFCPANGDKCWTTLSVDTVTTLQGIQYHPVGSTWYGALSLDMSTKTFLHLADDQTLRQYSHPARDLGFLGISFEVGQAGTPLFLDKDKTPPPPSTSAIIHEALKYALEDIATGFSASTSGNNIQSTNATLNDVGLKPDTSDTPPQNSATTEVTTLQLLNTFSNANVKNGHLKFFDRLGDSEQTAFFWGNAANTGALLAISAATGSGTWLQGGLSSLQHTTNLLPAWHKTSPEATYWIRFAVPQLMGLAGFLPSNSDKQSAFELTSAEGMMGNALRKSDAIVAHTYALGALQYTKQFFDKGTLSGQRTEIAVEHKLKSGFSTRYAAATPVLSLSNGNTASFVSNTANGLGVTDGNGSSYDTPTLSTTVSTMVGWRGVVGDQFFGSASIFTGTLIDLGPSDSPKIGVGGRASAGVGVGFGEDSKYKIGVEAFGGVSKLPNHSDVDYGMAATFTIQN